MNRTIILVFLLFLAVINTHAQDIRSQLRQIANDLTKQIEAKGKKRVAVASFLDLQNRETELGRYMADKFTLGLSSNPNFEVLDRSQLAQLMLENKLGANSILDPKTIPTLGKIAGVDVFITGNYAPLDNSIDLTVKIIDSQRAVRLGGSDGIIPRTPEINKLLNAVEESVEKETDVAKVDEKIKDCESKRVGRLCVYNNTKNDIELTFPGGDPKNLWIHGGKKEYTTDIKIPESENYLKLLFYLSKNGELIKSAFINIRQCETTKYVVD